MKRHALTTRLWHWLNALSLGVLFMSGLNISNGHPRLYWGHWGFAREDAWLHIARFPGWATIPDFYSLAQARLWHFLFAWIFAIGFIAFLLAAIANGHLWRDLLPRRAEWRWSAIRSDIMKHLQLDFEHPGTKFNLLQKIAYGVVIFVALPLMILTGLGMSPGMDAIWPWIVDVFGGRQSARSIHFLLAWFLLGFFIVHIVLVLLSGPIGQLRDMITGGRFDAGDQP